MWTGIRAAYKQHISGVGQYDTKGTHQLTKTKEGWTMHEPVGKVRQCFGPNNYKRWNMDHHIQSWNKVTNAQWKSLDSTWLEMFCQAK